MFVVIFAIWCIFYDQLSILDLTGIQAKWLVKHLSLPSVAILNYIVLMFFKIGKRFPMLLIQ